MGILGESQGRARGSQGRPQGVPSASLGGPRRVPGGPGSVPGGPRGVFMRIPRIPGVSGDVLGIPGSFS